jgi:hypothetical protein
MVRSIFPGQSAKQATNESSETYMDKLILELCSEKGKALGLQTWPYARDYRNKNPFKKVTNHEWL